MASKRKVKFEISWGVDGRDQTATHWAIYGTKADTSLYAKGARLATVPFATRKVELELEEGRWRFIVVPRNDQGSEPPFQKAERTEASIKFSKIDAPSTPSETVATTIDATASQVVEATVPDVEDNVESIQMVEGPSEYRGKMVANQPVRQSAFDQGAVPAQVMEMARAHMGYGLSESDFTRALQVLHRGPGGRNQSSAVEHTPFMPDMADAGLIELAAIDTTSGLSLDNFPSPTGTDSFEDDASDGRRARAIPTQSACDSDWGTQSSGLLCDQPAGACHMVNHVIETDEIDNGSDVFGVLDIFDELQRKSDELSDFAAKRATFPACPISDPALANVAADMRMMAGMYRQDCKPATPIMPSTYYWEAKSHASDTDLATYQRYRPGMIMRGQFWRFRLTMAAPTGREQLIIPNVRINLRPKIQLKWGTDTVPGGVASAGVTVPTDRVTGGNLFANSYAVFTQSVIPGQVTFAANIAAGAFAVTHQDMAGATPVSPTTFFWLVIGY